MNLDDLSLDDLASRIQAEHKAATRTIKQHLQRAIAAGEMLNEAKRQLEHGKWRPWLATTTVPPRTATHYMLLARDRAVLLNKKGNVADLTVREAVRLLAGTLPGQVRPRGDPADLTKPFLIPPFSVLDARSKYWQTRKRAWIDLGIKSELGRDGEVFSQSSLNDLMLQRRGLAAVVPHTRETAGRAKPDKKQ